MEEDKEVPVRVSVRARPLIEGSDVVSCVEFVPDLPQVIVADEKGFTFDNAFNAHVTQEEVYQTCVAPLVKKLFQGYNVTVLAYGQTGTGKTYTMGTDYRFETSTHDSVGIIPRVLAEIFEATDNSSSFDIQVSFLEIYNEEVFDLLCADKQREPISIREQANAIQVFGLEKKSTKSSEDALRWLEEGSIARTTGATAMNSCSSRSHAIFTLYIQMTDNDGEVTKLSKLHLVDLAGSETIHRTKTVGDRFREGVNINLSLLALGNVIRALFNRNIHPHIHVPYRESTLTRLLKDSIGENSYTQLITCISISGTDFVETVNTLRYADMARQIKSKPIINKLHSKDSSLLKSKLSKLPPTPADWRKRMNTTVLSCAPTPTPVKRSRINVSVDDNSMLTSTVHKRWNDCLPPKFSEDIFDMKFDEQPDASSVDMKPDSHMQSPEVSYMQPPPPNTRPNFSPFAKKVCNMLEESMCARFQELESNLLVCLKNKIPKTPARHPHGQQLTPLRNDILKIISKEIRKSAFFSSPFKDKTNMLNLPPVTPVVLKKQADCSPSKFQDDSITSNTSLSELNDTVIKMPSRSKRKSLQVASSRYVTRASSEQCNVKQREKRSSLAPKILKTCSFMQKKHNKLILHLLNTGSCAQLQKLPCIGPKSAYILNTWVKIKGPFKSILELSKVEGLSKNFLQRFSQANLVVLDS